MRPHSDSMEIFKVLIRAANRDAFFQGMCRLSQEALAKSVFFKSVHDAIPKQLIFRVTVFATLNNSNEVR